jgi:hypothetical protein
VVAFPGLCLRRCGHCSRRRGFLARLDAVQLPRGAGADPPGGPARRSLAADSWRLRDPPPGPRRRRRACLRIGGLVLRARPLSRIAVVRRLSYCLESVMFAFQEFWSPFARGSRSPGRRGLQLPVERPALVRQQSVEPADVGLELGDGRRAAGRPARVGRVRWIFSEGLCRPWTEEFALFTHG